jgi:hypothetical protein
MDGNTEMPNYVTVLKFGCTMTYLELKNFNTHIKREMFSIAKANATRPLVGFSVLKLYLPMMIRSHLPRKIFNSQ